MPRNIYHYRRHQKKRSHKGAYFLLIVGLLTVAGVRFTLVKYTDRTTEANASAQQSPHIAKVNTELPKPDIHVEWKKPSHAAIGALGYGVIDASENDQQPVPMASLAKVMAAILIMERNNVSNENPGAPITFTDYDEALYNKYLYMGGVVTPVKAGATMSQTDALKAMLMTSSNNIADSATLATFGTKEAYLEAANAKAAELDMVNTTYADITGFSPKTVATAQDLVLLAEYAMKNPLFAEIVSTWETTINGDLKIINTNKFLDYNGNHVLGIKTGLTDEAGGTYMTAARYKTKDGDEVLAIAVTLGAKTHFAAQESAMPLLKSVKQGFVQE